MLKLCYPKTILRLVIFIFSYDSIMKRLDIFINFEIQLGIYRIQIRFSIVLCPLFSILHPLENVSEQVVLGVPIPVLYPHNNRKH